jgi:hypothetical protein
LESGGARAVMQRYWRATAGLRSAVRSPADAALAARIALFAITAPHHLERTDVESYLKRLRRQSRPRAIDVRGSRERIVRLRNGVLGMPWIWRRNTCYLRALVLYRFLDGDGEPQLHVGVEEDRSTDRLHGHAWVSVGGEVIEGPDGVVLDRVREIPMYARR